MMTIAESPKIIGLANSLGLFEGDPVEAIRQHCLSRVNEIVAHRNKERPLSIDELEELVCKSLKFGVHRFWTDEQFEDLVQRYLLRGELVLKALAGTWGKEDYGVFIQLEKPNENGEPWICLIDCRGDKAYKRHWTFWHETTHCLTAVDEMQLPLRRTRLAVGTQPKDPIEVLTDFITKDLAFYPPIFDPILGHELAQSSGQVSFELVEKVRGRFCPEASFESTMNTVVDRCGYPCLILEAALGFNQKEKRAQEKGDKSILPSLRVARIYANELSRAGGLFIPPNYRIPSESVISLAHRQPARVSRFGLKRQENLGHWSDSKGRSLPNLQIYVQARRFDDHVLAIVGRAKADAMLQ